MSPLGPQILAQVEEKPQEIVQTNATEAEDKPHTMFKKLHVQNKFTRGKGSLTSDPKQVCASTIMKMDIKKEMFLVGDVVMRKFYTIFDRDNDRVGLARAHTPQQQAALAQQSLQNSLTQKTSKK